MGAEENSYLTLEEVKYNERFIEVYQAIARRCEAEQLADMDRATAKLKAILDDLDCEAEEAKRAEEQA